MKLTLVTIHIENSPQAFPLAGAVLAANVRTDTETALLDLYLDDTVKNSVDRILYTEPDIVGFSVYLWNTDKVFEIAESLKKVKPGISLIAGGPEVTADPQNFDRKHLFTSLFHGEGELTLNDFLSRYAKGLKPEKMYVQKTGLDLPSLSSPFLEGTINLAEYDGILWEFSRGCVFNCSFCFESRGIRRVRSYPFERIKNELETIKKAGVNQIFILDPTFNINTELAKEILRLIRKTVPEIHFTFEIRSEFLDEETAELFADITCSIQIGLQSSDPGVLEKVNRKIDREDFYEKILLLHEAGAVYGFDLIYGLPGDTFEGFCRSLDYALSLRPNHLDIFPLAVLKGTELYGTAGTYGIQYKENNPYTVINTPEFSSKELGKAEKLAQACSVFYNKGEAVSWFFMITRSLDISPSLFLMEFTRFMENRKVSDSADLDSIMELQTSFVSDIFKKASRTEEGAVACDIINWFGTLSLAERNPGISITRSFSRNMENVLDNLESGIDNLDELAFFNSSEPCTVEFYTDETGVCSRIITD